MLKFIKKSKADFCVPMHSKNNKFLSFVKLSISGVTVPVILSDKQVVTVSFMHVKVLPNKQIIQNFAPRLVMIMLKQFDSTNGNAIFSSFSNQCRTNRDCSAPVWFLFATFLNLNLSVF